MSLIQITVRPASIGFNWSVSYFNSCLEMGWAMTKTKARSEARAAKKKHVTAFKEQDKALKEVAGGKKWNNHSDIFR